MMMVCEGTPCEKREPMPTGMPAGTYLICGKVRPEQQIPPQEQKQTAQEEKSAWGRSCEACTGATGGNFGSEAEVGGEGMHRLPARSLCGLPCDSDTAGQGFLVAALEVHQKRTEELHAKLLDAFREMEERVGQTLRESLLESTGSLRAVAAPSRIMGTESNERRGARSRTFVKSSSRESSPKKNDSVIPKNALVTINLASVRETPKAPIGLPSKLKERVIWGVRHPMFDIASSIVLWTYILVTLIEGQYAGYKANVSLGLDTAGEWQGAEDGFMIMDNVFNTLFAVEISLRLWSSGIGFLKTCSGFFDFALIFLSCLDSYLLSPLGVASDQDYGMLRVVRVIRILRTLRVAREMRVMKPLYLFVRTIVSSMFALFWSLIFLVTVQILGAVAISKSLHGFILDTGNNMEDRLWANRMFGSTTKSLYTFFEITFSGGWPNHVRPLMEKVSFWYAVFFIFYISVWAFAIMKIIGALFIKETFSVSDKDEESQVRAKTDEKMALVKRFKQVLRGADTSNDGEVNFDEFATIFEDSRSKNWFAVHEIDVNDARLLWELIDDGSEEMRIEDFVEGMLRMKGSAKALDLMALARDCRDIHCRCEAMHSKLDGLASRVASLEPRVSARVTSRSSA